MPRVNDIDLFRLRAAAAEWLSVNASSPNAPAVRAALFATQQGTPDGDPPQAENPARTGPYGRSYGSGISSAL